MSPATSNTNGRVIRYGFGFYFLAETPAIRSANSALAKSWIDVAVPLWRAVVGQ